MIWHAPGSADWQGMAPAAKLAFQDLGRGTSGAIDLVGDLSVDYYPYTYARCVRMRERPMEQQPACMSHQAGDAACNLIVTGPWV